MWITLSCVFLLLRVILLYVICIENQGWKMFKNKFLNNCFVLVIIAFCSSLSFAAIPAKVKMDSKSQTLWAELTGKNIQKLDDQGIYSEVVAHYQTRDVRGLKFYLEALIKRFPTSPYADNALYLGGQLALETKNYPDALRHFQKLTQFYPLSNRMVAAQFSKGIAYKKMNLEPQARKVFFELRKKYPGSPESFRAETELKLIR